MHTRVLRIIQEKGYVPRNPKGMYDVYDAGASETAERCREHYYLISVEGHHDS